MSTVSVMFLYVILFIISIYNLITEYKNKKLINSFICLQTAFILYYIIIPIISILITTVKTEQLTGMILRISSADFYDIIYAYIYTVVSYMLILIVYHVKFSSKPQSIKIYDVENINTGLNNLREQEDKYLNDSVYRIAIAAGLFTLVVGIVAELLISNSLGGIFKSITMGDKLRGFGKDISRYIPQNRLFAIVLMVSSLASTYFFVYALRVYKHFSIKLLLFVSLLTSAYYLLFNAGRLGVLLFILTFLFDYAFRKAKHPFIIVAIFSVFSFAFLGALNDLFFYLSYGYVKESSAGFLSIINEFAFPYLNLLNVHKINELYGFRFGIDYVTWIINVVPTTILKLFGLSKVTKGYQFITEYYSGINAAGGTPTDLLTLGIRQFGLIGIFINSMLISLFCKYFDKIIERLYSTNFIFMSLRISSIMFIIVPYSDLDSFVRNRYDMIMVFLFTTIIYKIRLNNTKYTDITKG